MAALSLVFLLIAIVMGSIINPSVLQALGTLGAAICKVYNWLVEVIAGLAALIVAPFFWLVSLFTRLFPPKPKSSASAGQPPKRPRFPVHTPSTFDVIIPFVRIILPILFLLLVFLLICCALPRRRTVPVTSQRHKED